ncbi:hypothetical protein, partial [Mycobacterium ulcerans]
SIVLQIARAYTAAPIARHQRSSTQLTSLLINNAGALICQEGGGSEYDDNVFVWGCPDPERP